MATIPEYEGVRAVVPDTYDPLRRAGSGGQRYFTDMQYVPDPTPTFSGDRLVHDTTNYLAANPDLVTYYNANKDALIAGGDDQFDTVEGYGKWHYDTHGQFENRNLTPTHDADGNLIVTPVGAANTRAATQQTALKTANLANKAREGLSSLQRVTDSALATDIGEIQAYDATDREKIDQVIGYMNEQAVSPYRLSTVTSTPLSDIQTAMNPYYRTEAEQKAQSTPNVGIQTALNQAVTESQTRPYQNFLRHIPVDGTYSAEEIGSVTDLLNSGTITIDQIATYFNVPVEEVRQFYQEQGNRQGFQAGGLTSIGPRGMYLGGSTDGMADNIPASINSNQPARLSDGEFVVPADVVSHLGNGNSDAGAHQLYGMMDRVRKARTGTAEQGRQINPGNFLT